MKLFHKNKAGKGKEEKAPKEKKQKPEKVMVKKIGLRRKSVIALWMLLIGSVAFGVYKNYTAVDTRTEVVEKTIEMKLFDTNAVETYVVNFAKVYHTWSKKQKDLDGRMQNLGNYMTESLLQMNAGLLDHTTVTDATVQEVQVWDVKAVDGKENEYRVVYSVKQKITSYLERASKDKKKKEKKETEKELVYYVKDGLLKPLDGKYTYWEVQSPIFTEGKENSVRVNFNVKYFDEISQTPQLSQYDFTLEKGDNWKIVKIH